MRMNFGLKFRLSLTLLSFVVLGVGCISFSGGGGANTGADGGIWKSADKGTNWLQKSLIATVTAQKKSIGATNITAIAADPEDHNALYAGTAENGMFYTLDAGESWMQVTSLHSGKVASIAVDPRNKCVIYAAFENKVLRSTDCNRTWSTMYFETRTDKAITSLALDPSDGKNVYAGTSTGDLVRSADGGGTWVTVNRFKSEVKKILIAPYDPKIVYIGTKSSGIWKSGDAGATWNDLSADLKKFSGAFDYRDLALDISAPETLVYASQFGILRSTDGGAKWEKIELLTPPGSATIYSLAVNPQNGKEIYYGTATTFYRSEDGGIKWRTRKLPTSRAATSLLIDPVAPSVLYLGVTRIAK